MTPAQKIQAARTTLILDQPFFGALALRLAVIEDPSCPTAWTDGSSLGYNPDFVASLTMEETIGLLAHEVLHCANGHPWRRDSREPRKFNVAADYAINYILGDCHFKLPEGALRDGKYDGKSAEWIYARLPDDPPNGPGRGQGDQPGQGAPDVRDAPTGPATEEGASEADWQQAVMQAAQAAKMRGNLPGTLARFAKQAAAPKVDWRSVLHRFVQQNAKDDYSWASPSRRYLPSGLYLPSLKSETVGPLAVVVDTSGSVDDVLLSQFAAEIRAVADDVHPERVHVIFADAAVQRIDTFERDEVIEMRPAGGGGTDFRPAFKAVEAFEEPPVCVIYLTDGQGTFPKSSEIPTLWALTGPVEVPFGEAVMLN